MPRRATASGGRPVTGSPANTIRPRVGARCPVIRSKSVVFPAPLGPMTARRSRGATASDTRSRAARAPKYRVSPSIRRSGGTVAVAPPSTGRAGTTVAPASPAMRRPSASPPDPRPDHADDPAGRDEDEEDEGDPQDEHPALGVGRDEALQQDEHRRAQDRAAQRPDPADDDHEERFARRGPEEGIGRDG